MRSRPEWRDVLECLAGSSARPGACAIATVLRAQGSAPLPCGSQAVLNGARLLAGTIGGGALEAEAMRRGAAVAAGDSAVVFDFPLQGPGGFDPNPICGGIVRVLVQPVTETIRAVYREAWEASRNRETGVLETRVLAGIPFRIESRWWSTHDIAACSDSAVAGLLHAALGAAEARCLLGSSAGEDELAALLHVPVHPQPQLLIAGAGHVGQALAAAAALTDFSVTVVDDRLEWMEASGFPPETRRICSPIAAAIANLPIDSDTYIALVTRGHRVDAEALAACLHSPAAYIGMIGSKRKVTLMREHFLTTGLATEQELARIHAPIGLDIGAETAPEIAVSILAQMIAVRRTAQYSRSIPNQSAAAAGS